MSTAIFDDLSVGLIRLSRRGKQHLFSLVKGSVF